MVAVSKAVVGQQEKLCLFLLSLSPTCVHITSWPKKSISSFGLPVTPRTYREGITGHLGLLAMLK